MLDDGLISIASNISIVKIGGAHDNYTNILGDKEPSQQKAEPWNKHQ